LSETSQLTGKVEKLLPGGEAVVHSNRATFLVANVIPGDTIDFQPAEKRRGAMRGVLTTLQEASPMRVEALCPVADFCGGCSLQHLKPGMHGEIKSAWVLDIFSSFIGSESAWTPAGNPAEPRRRRVRWFAGASGEQSFLGFIARASYTVVRHDHCMVLSDGLNQLRYLIEQVMRKDE